MIYPTKTVYLAGPITGLSYGEARRGWREEFASLLPEHIFPLSPMRAKEFLRREKKLEGSPSMYASYALARPSGIVARDRNDVRTCDAMVACLLGAEAASVGTCIEYGWADAFRKPIVTIIEEHPENETNPHNHGMLIQVSGYVIPSIEEAAHIVTHLLTSGV